MGGARGESGLVGTPGDAGVAEDGAPLLDEPRLAGRVTPAPLAPPAPLASAGGCPRPRPRGGVTGVPKLSGGMGCGAAPASTGLRFSTSLGEGEAKLPMLSCGGGFEGPPVTGLRPLLHALKRGCRPGPYL